MAFPFPLRRTAVDASSGAAPGPLGSGTDGAPGTPGADPRLDTDDPRRLRDEFERLSVYVDGAWDHNAWYHPWLLAHVPRPCRLALDVGSGGGRFTRELARRCDHVFGLDISPATVAAAERLTARRLQNVEFVTGDVREMDLPPNTFDCIVSIACLHHLDLDAAYRRLAQALRPSGILLVVDLVRSKGLKDRGRDLVAAPVAAFLNLFHTGHLRRPHEQREAWREHGENDAQQLTTRQVKAIAARALPGAQVDRRLLWRYSLIWQKP